MTYSSNEKSLSDGMPIEVYKFTTPSRVYRHAASFKPETVNSERYTPVQGGIVRNDMDIGTVISSLTTVDITVPIDTALARDIGFANTPDYMYVQILRAHRNDNMATEWRQVYSGDAVNYITTTTGVTIKTGSVLQSQMQSANNSIYYQRPCNHVLYDNRCRVSLSANTHATVITAIGVEAVLVASTGFADTELAAGIITNSRTGESRFMLNNTVNTIDIDSPFYDLNVGDAVTVSRGCNRSRARCVSGFNNGSNFGGFLHIPTKNPFQEG